MVTWWYSESGFQVGPVDPDCIRRLLQARRVGAATLFWREGMAEWLPASQVPDLRGFVPAGNPPPPRRATPQVVALAPFTASQLVGSDVWQKLIATVTGLALLSLTLFFAASTLKVVLGKQATETATQAASAGKRWQNPVTHRSVQIAPSWQATSTVTLGQRDYLFADAGQRTLLKLTKEEANDLSLEKFVALLRQKTSTEVALTDEGRFGWRQGARIWQAQGRLAANPDLLLEIQLLQIGSTYWQIITLHHTSDLAAIDLLDTLRSALWETVASAAENPQ